MYNLHRLGWNSFQQLCLTITREILGQTVESFLDTNDGGRDGAFTGEWKAKGAEDLHGSFVIQCKFTNRPGHNLTASALSDEVEKAAKLVKQGLCESYVLMTNAGLSGASAAGVRELLKAVGVRHVRTLGSTWITQQILENKRLRMHVPRLYGLGDLSQILDERAYTQAQSILESMREDLSKVVVTDAYRRSADAIDKHSFVLLIGEPASGKTTIASLLSMAAIDRWNASVLKLEDPASAVERWNPHEQSQFFWLDDAFGVTQYDDSQVRHWNRILPRIQPMLLSGAKIIMTSRDYIYNRARRDLKESAFPLLNESQVVINMHDLSVEEKEQILYNHIKLGTQSLTFRKTIKPYLEDIASHPGFIPETARRLGNPLFTKELFITAEGVNQFVEKREHLLQEVIHSLDADSKTALALIYMRNGQLDSPITLTPSETQALERLGSTIGGCVIALDALRGSLTRHSIESGESLWQFQHPTIGDACAAILAQNPEYIDIFIQGSEPQSLIRQVSCGDVGIEKAIVVPKSLFSQMITKLKDLPSRSSSPVAFWLGRDLHGFLTHRCSKEFLSLYLEHDSAILDRVSKPRPSLKYSPEVKLAKRLHDFGLLPDSHRKRFVEAVTDYAVQGDDPGALNDDAIRSVFTDYEFQKLVRRLRDELVPQLAEIREAWEYNVPEDELPRDYVQPLLEFLESVKTQFQHDESVVEDIDNEIWLLDEWIDENTRWGDDVDRWELEIDELPENPRSTRSVFDDIDGDEIAEDG